MNIDTIPPSLPSAVTSVNADIEKQYLFPKQIITRGISKEESKYYNLENSLTINATSFLLLELEKSKIKSNTSIVSVHPNNLEEYQFDFNLFINERIEYKVSDFAPKYNFIDEDKIDFEFTDKAYKMDFEF